MIVERCASIRCLNSLLQFFFLETAINGVMQLSRNGEEWILNRIVSKLMRIFLESASAAAFHCRSAASAEFFEGIDRVSFFGAVQIIRGNRNCHRSKYLFVICATFSRWGHCKGSRCHKWRACAGLLYLRGGTRSVPNSSLLHCLVLIDRASQCWMNQNSRSTPYYSYF